VKTKLNISRESKILLGVILLALGIYLWFNFLSQNNSSLLPSFLGGNSSAPQIITSPRASNPRVSGSVTVPSTNNTGSSQVVVAPLASNPQTVNTTDPNSTVATTAREIVIVDLPFLVTEAPTEEEALANSLLEENTSQGQTLRATVNPFSPIIIEVDKDKNAPSPGASVQQVNGTPRPPSTPIVGNGNNTTTNVYSPPTKLIESAPLRTVAPAPALANNLPRTLSTGTLNATPGILRNQNIVPPLASEVAAAEKARAEAEALAAKRTKEAAAAQALADQKAEEAQALANQTAEQAAATAAEQAAQAEQEAKIAREAARLAAIEAAKPSLRMPQGTSNNLPLAAATTSSTVSANTLPNILTTGRGAEDIAIAVVPEDSQEHVIQTDPPTVVVVDSAQNTEANDSTDTLVPPTVDGAPNEVGGSDLARYLRNNNFQYTGSVRGVVSVGMFRTSSQALTITLGQKIPKTDIVLTDLQNNQAEFTQGQDKVILNLDLRR